jgi:hypothetical protein
MVVKKIKDIKKKLGEIVHEYDKIFKNLLNQIPYIIDKKMLVQWYVVGLLQTIRAPLQMYDVHTCEEALKNT